MKSRFLGLALSTILFLWTTDLYGQWVHTGYPDSVGWVSCLAAKENKLFAGTWGRGVFRSTDGGETWEQVNFGLSNVWVHALAVVPSSGGGGSTNLFAGVRGGACRSHDDGMNWVSVNSGFDPAIEVQAFGVAGTTILAGAAQQGYISGVYRSVNDGASWANCTFGFTNLSDSSIYSFTSTTSGGQTYFYAGTGQGVFFSSSDGTSWSAARTGLPAAVVRSLAVNPGSPYPMDFDVLAGVDDYGVFRSTDNGTSWSQANNGIPGQHPVITDFAVSASRARVFVTDGYVRVSLTGGEDWLDTGWPYVEAGPAECLAVSGDYLYAGVNHGIGGIWKYCIAADTDWVVQSSGTMAALYEVKAVDNSLVWCGGANGTVLRTTNGGNTWTSVGGGAIGSDVVSAVEPLDANTALVATASMSGTQVFKTTNAGTSWSAVFNQTGGTIAGIQMKTTTEGYAVGYPVGGKWTVLKTTNSGTTWARIVTEPVQVGSEEGSLSVQLLGNTIWFGTTTGKVYRSTDLGVTWTSSPTSGAIVYSLHFNTPSLGLIGFDGGGSNCSTNGGGSWTSVHAAGYNNVMSMSGIGNEFWAITGKAIAYTSTSGQSWKYSSPGHAGFTNLLAVSMSPVPSPVNGWAVGDSGLILHYQRRATAVAQRAALVPTECTLEQNYPNPFNPATTIRYALPQASHVTLKVYDVLGREVATLVNEEKQAGTYTVQWDASGTASGMYFYRMQAGDFNAIKKFLLLK